MPYDNCYESAFYLLLQISDDNIVLVHGIPTGQGRLEGIRYGHAWIEVGDVVIDNRAGVFRKDLYYSVGQIEYTVRYSKHDALKLFADNLHPGPWDKVIHEAVHKK